MSTSGSSRPAPRRAPARVTTAPTTPRTRRRPHDRHTSPQPSHARRRRAGDRPPHHRRAGPPDAAPARARRPVFPLGWLRGLAALCVVFFHAYQNNRSGPTSAWPWSGNAHQLMLGSDLFVDMFFLLSGLVLWLPIARVLRGRPARPTRTGAALPPDGAADAAVRHGRARRLGGHQPGAAGPLGRPGVAPDVHPRLQRPVHLLDRRTRVVAGRGGPLLRADGARGAVRQRRGPAYGHPPRDGSPSSRRCPSCPRSPVSATCCGRPC